MSTSTRFVCLGPTVDGRTNQWRLALPCGHDKKPDTTLFDKQYVQCDTCQREFLVNYNDQTMEASP